MVYRKLEVRVDRFLIPTLQSLSPGTRQLLFEELEVFAGTEEKTFYRSQTVDDLVVYEIGIAGIVLAFVALDEIENCVYLFDIDVF